MKTSDIHISETIHFSKALLDSLAVSSDAVWCIDLATQTVHILHDKLTPDRNGAHMPLAAAKAILQSCVHPDDIEALLHLHDPDVLKELKRTKVNVSRFISKNGTIYTMRQVWSPDIDENGDTFAVYISLYSLQEQIDEQKHQKQLTKAIGNLYFCAYEIDCDACIMREIYAPEYVTEICDVYGNAMNKLYAIRDSFFDPLSHAEAEDFLNWYTIQERMQDRKSISLDYLSKNRGWCRASFVEVERKADGDVGKLLFVIMDIDESKRAELEQLDRIYSAQEEAEKALRKAEKSNRVLEKKVQLSKALAEESREFLELLTDVTESGVWYIILDETLQPTRVVCTDKIRRMLGYEDETDFPNTGEAFLGSIHPDDIGRVVRKNAEVAASGTAYDIKFRMRRKTGEYRTFQSLGKPARFVNGKPTLFFGTLIDITAAEEKNLESAHRLDALLGGVNGGIIVTETAVAHRFTYISEGAAAIQGYTPEELLGYTNGSAAANVYEEDRKALLQDVEARTENTGSFRILCRVLHKDGRLLWVESYAKLVTQPDGKKLLYGFVQDVTEREENRIRLEAERAQYRAVLTENSFFNFTFDVDDGYFRKEVYTETGEAILGNLGMTLPADYDEAFRRFTEKFQPRFPHEDDKRFFSCAGLREMHAEKKKSMYVEYYVPPLHKHVSVLTLLAKDPVTGHLILNASALDITERAHRDRDWKRG